jgi:8-oxo-dGTP pyrophosphatase MutT (NUDIX family)
MKAWDVLERRALLERRWLRIEQQRIGLPNGGEIDEFHLIESPDWAAVLALTEQQEVVLVEQYRHGASRISRELPAGVIDEGETPRAAAERELLEETGYGGGDWRSLSSVSTEPARHTTRAHFFFATGVSRLAAPRVEASECIEVHLVTVPELLRAIDDGSLFHGVHIGAIATALRRGWLLCAAGGAAPWDQTDSSSRSSSS